MYGLRGNQTQWHSLPLDVDNTYLYLFFQANPEGPGLAIVWSVSHLPFGVAA